jgi:hypothetical protein
MKMRGAVLLCAAAIMASVSFPPVLMPQAEIQCGKTGKRYDQPYQCAKECKGQIDAERCMIQPDLKILDDGYFKTYYNSSLFFAGNSMKALTCYDDTASKAGGNSAGNGVKFDGTLGQTSDRTLTLPAMIVGPMGGGFVAPASAAYHKMSRDLLVERIFGRWLHPWDWDTFTITWTTDKGAEAADLSTEPDRCGKYDLSITVQSLCRSPASFIVVLGHEMVHREQYSRTYPGLERDTLGKLRADLHEVEAYAWELRQGKFNWKFDTIDRNPLYPGLTKEEIQESQKAQQCYEWDAEKHIEQDRGFGRSKELMALYFKEDPWISQEWLPKHTDWATHNAGPIPDPATCCPFLEAEETACRAYIPNYPKHEPMHDPGRFSNSQSASNKSEPCPK